MNNEIRLNKDSIIKAVRVNKFSMTQGIIYNKVFIFPYLNGDKDLINHPTVSYSEETEDYEESIEVDYFTAQDEELFMNYYNNVLMEGAEVAIVN